MGTNQSPKVTQPEPSTALAYLDPRYWDERFSKEEQYEWFKDYSHFRHLIQAHVSSHSSVLELGCGNSQMCEELYKDGVTNITCIDLSCVAVERMQKRIYSRGFKENMAKGSNREKVEGTYHGNCRNYLSTKDIVKQVPSC